jgi:hypothetical protein
VILNLILPISHESERRKIAAVTVTAVKRIIWHRKDKPKATLHVPWKSRTRKIEK